MKENKASKKESRLLSELKQALKNRPKWLTNEQISLDVNVSVGTISGIERGTIKNPGVNIVEAINDYLKETANKGA